MLGAGSSLLTSLASNPNLSSFASLLQTPGLDKALGSALKGDFTMLAPTNSALSGLGQDALTNLTKSENIDQLAGMLKNQIVPGKLDASQLAAGGVKTAGGNNLNLGTAQLGEMIKGKNFNIIPVDQLLK
ncbi:hypothetical protein FPE01S_01_04730 [Flavihumibacter petaseus NBRC 106054]|uniref:FAS1 domain-containing protein n=2 Tax=Flavihumibacter TaxID=1004301 RepID=A0A0E9MWH9_9BACT|nr:hypothetical protein FPE01S_01_04730 [Flavihumibacter petaseus NBRC 106054]